MFESARLKLTAWYLLIIMLISVFFSIAFYHSSTREIQMLIDRIKMDQQRTKDSVFIFSNRPSLPFTLDELEDAKQRIMINLTILNGIILVFAGAAGYFLAGRTLRPIKIMIDEQNQFISSSSHELRTPITSMRAEMEGNLMEKHISDKRARALIKSNLEELAELQELTNNLLQLAQVHSIQLAKYDEEVSIKNTLLSVQKKISPLAKKKNIRCDFNLVDGIVIGQEKNLREVFVILLENAIKYSPEKSTIKVVSKKIKNTIEVSVKDKGIGISETDLPRIFERFYRADKSRHKDGYGLGLSIAKKIVEMHGGSIKAESKEGKGSLFIVTLPLKK